ncbi:MAG TPA: hypothetical protein VEV41_21220 [Terriglobales bacterium]|nr:hypothetical protein [Terriglobales bacterium]
MHKLNALSLRVLFYTWIYRIVTSLCLDQLRKKNSRGRDATIVSPDGEEEEVLDCMSDHHPGSIPERSLAGPELRKIIRSRVFFHRAKPIRTTDSSSNRFLLNI